MDTVASVDIVARPLLCYQFVVGAAEQLERSKSREPQEDSECQSECDQVDIQRGGCTLRNDQSPPPRCV